MTTQAISHRRPGLRLAPATLAVAAALAGWSTASHALRFGSEEGLSGSFDSIVSFGLTQRMSSPDCRVLGNDSGGCNNGSNNTLQARQGANGYANADFNFTNFDDGNLNYKKGDIVSAVLKGTHDLALKAPDGWSALGRMYWFHDFRSDQTQRTDLTDSSVTAKATLLDAWIAKEVRYGDQRGKIKVGNQVISWGEDIFILGGVNQINALDLQKFHVPGTQIKEIFVPAPMVSWSGGINERLGLEAYPQPP